MKFVLSNDINRRLSTVAVMANGERAVAIFPTEQALKDYEEVVEMTGEKMDTPGLTFDTLASVKKDAVWEDRHGEAILGLIIDDVGGFVNAALKHLGIDLPVIYAMVKDNGNTFVLAPPSEDGFTIPSPDQVAEIITKSQDGVLVVKE